eukprot:m.10029 g.10029  ORF g.10029 m.10029 type:complete len:193 (-) comp4185_c0_seq1:57-635(-)
MAEPEATANESQEIQPPSLEQLVTSTSTSYGAYVKVDDNESFQQDVSNMTEDVNTLLARMDEFHGLISSIEAESSAVVNTAGPQLEAQCKQIKALFERILKLEQFVGIVRRSVNNMDDSIIDCEKEHTIQPLKTAREVLSGKLGFFQSKKMQTAAAVESNAEGEIPEEVKKPIAEPFQTAPYFPASTGKTEG